MTPQEKAEAYDKALEEAKKWHKAFVMGQNYPATDIKVSYECIFPELKESEDEKIRKDLIEWFEEFPDSIWRGHHKKDILAWLEKQENCEHIRKEWLEHIKQSWYKEGFIDGKYSNETPKEWAINDATTLNELLDFLENGTAKLQHDLTRYANWLKIHFSPIEKQGKKNLAHVEPKFKVGDWIVNDYCIGKVIELTDDAYLLNTGQGIPFSCEHNTHLWSIQDAKDGDVLACEGKHGQEIGIVKKYIGKYGGCDKCFETYCFVDWDGVFRVGEHMGSRNIHPATKEQWDTIKRAMDNASYKWNNEELKLEQVMGQEEKEDSRIKRCILLVKKMNEKMHYYENELRKSECEVECDNVDWIDLCSDMFSLLEEVKEELLVNPTLFETPESADIKASYEAIFPELKESEDEKIRKELLEHCKNQAKPYIQTGNKCPQIQSWIAWLEKVKEPKDKGEISDGYHTFNELYYYRMLYNAAFFNLLPKEWVHKSKKHHDGEECFGGGWFIVMANLPTGQISNHYELKDWDLFQVQEKETADEWDGHTPQEAAERLHKYLLDCCKTNDNVDDFNELEAEAPMGYGKIIDEKLQEAVKRYFADEKDPNRYCLADVFYAGMRAEREKFKS